MVLKELSCWYLHKNWSNNIDRVDDRNCEIYPKSSRSGYTNAYFCYLRAIESSRARTQSDESKKINIYFVIFVDWYIVDNLTSESRNEAVPRTFWNRLGNLDEKLSCELSDTIGLATKRSSCQFSATFPSLTCVIGETRAKACRIKPVS